MKITVFTIATFSLLPATGHAAALQRRASDYISSCGPSWMAVNNVKTNHDTVERTGFNTAVDKFCNAAHGAEVGAKLFLSMATRVWLGYGADPKTTGINGYVYFEIHNKQNDKHIVDGGKCKEYLKNLSKDGSKCYGGKSHDDTKGGTWQVGNDLVSYHAIADKVPPIFEQMDKPVVLSNAIAPLSNNGKGKTLDPFPVEGFGDSVPFACHSHNDYERDTALYSALSAGCVSVEADIWEINGDLIVKHNSGDGNGNTLQNLYLNPLKALVDKNKAIFPKAPKQSLNLLIDFKNDADKTWDLLVKQLQPLRDAGYLSTSSDGQFKQGLITIIASGNGIADKDSNAPKPLGRDNPQGAIFADARIDKDMVNFNAGNAYFASAKYSDRGTNEAAKRDEAHKKGFKVRYWDGPASTADWQILVDEGVDRVNVDELQNVAAVAWRGDLL
ncbi:hypothetical protein K458DRAFT_390526 [Lentithecium fluviatile CBS 122367]|uniref:Altered inheritance of mitochondria protein 6 n=1 Tax=Lentithecium fluviatile CBS 122367 TaxID=1168545 RepID=A0A6G1IXD3_9PLEO|nr:hypothetical protein K458DRAFT_390526 [Lentithecium fluviatile CBS 122367]